MFEFSVETLRFPSGCEPLSLKSLKLQVPFCSVALEQEPFTENLMAPLSSGIVNLSAGVKVVAA